MRIVVKLFRISYIIFLHVFSKRKVYTNIVLTEHYVRLGWCQLASTWLRING